MNGRTHRATLQWVLAALLTVNTSSTLFGADMSAYPGRPTPPRVYYGLQLPPPADVEDTPLISLPTTPILPGSSTLPGYYGRPFDYYYQGEYYGGGPYPSYFWRLPYACGIYGYC
jgi:hypothetical protein